MIVLGIHGGPDFVDDNWAEGPLGNHDAAAAILCDGELVAAVEEERLNRCKHTNKAPVQSIAYCLRAAGLSLADVDVIAIPQTESDLNGSLVLQYQTDLRWRERLGYVSGRTYIVNCLQRVCGVTVHPHQLYFTHHHIGHAASAFYLSGYDRALVIALDGYGGSLSGLVAIGEGARIEPLRVTPGAYTHGPAKLMADPGYFSDSLGLFYLAVTEFLGFRIYDEYKVMGLAPYGDPAVFRDRFRETYSLLPDGRYRVHWDRLTAIRDALPPPPADRVFAQPHKDAAAGVQEALTTIVAHVLAHWRRATGLDHLCIAGGVGLNCTLNGAILRSGEWRDVFVQPASHDGGLALGAALDAHHRLQDEARRVSFSHVYLGPDCGSTSEIARELAAWDELLAFDTVDDVCVPVAEAIAEGAIVGWMQGRTEFGPRALGNRSILADPRPSANVALINEMIKQREAFRPFAPAVLEECAAAFFELPEAQTPLDFMLASVQVRPAKRSLLGATTHVDGSARIQIVRKQTNPLFWRLIHAFHARTGVPVLLNTSFNNNYEPIVNSVADAIACFLTTELTLLVIGQQIIRKRSAAQIDRSLRGLTMTLAPSRRLRYLAEGDARQGRAPQPFSLSSTVGDAAVPISASMFALLTQADGRSSIDDLLRQINAEAGAAALLLREIRELWTRRAIVLAPGRSGRRPERFASSSEPAIRRLLADELARVHEGAR